MNTDRLTPSEIEVLREDKKKAIERLDQLRAEEKAKEKPTTSAVINPLTPSEIQSLRADKRAAAARALEILEQMEPRAAAE